MSGLIEAAKNRRFWLIWQEKQIGTVGAEWNHGKTIKLMKGKNHRVSNMETDAAGAQVATVEPLSAKCYKTELHCAEG